MFAYKPFCLLCAVCIFLLVSWATPTFALPVTFKPTRTLQVDGGEPTLTFSPDEKTLVSGSKKGLIQFWNVATGRSEQPLEPHGGDVGSLRYSADGKHLVAIFDDSEGTFSAENKTDYNKAVVVASWDATSRRLEHSFRLTGDEKFNYDISPDGRSVTACASSYDYGAQLTLWDVSTGKLLRAHNVHGSNDCTVNFAPNGQTAVASDLFGKIMIWSVKDGTFRIVGKNAFSVILSPDEKFMAGIGESGAVRLYNSATGHIVRELPQYSNETLSYTFSPNSLIFITGGGDPDSRVRLWNVGTGRLVNTLSEHSKGKGVSCLTFSQDGTLFASADVQGKVVLWHVE